MRRLAFALVLVSFGFALAPSALALDGPEIVTCDLDAFVCDIHFERAFHGKAWGAGGDLYWREPCTQVCTPVVCAWVRPLVHGEDEDQFFVSRCVTP